MVTPLIPETELYVLSYDLIDFSAGTLSVTIGGRNVYTHSYVGSTNERTYTHELIFSSTADLTFTPSETARLKIDNISLKKVNGGNLYVNKQLGINSLTPTAALETISTTEQFRLGYDVDNYVSTTVGSTGGVTMDAVGSGASFTFNDPVKVIGTITLLGTTNNCILTVDADATCDAGTKIGEDNSIALCMVCAAN
jgi:hypothetical protein